jgi:serine/threonine-protein kinase
VWDNVQTLQEHLRLRQQYGAKLLWSGDDWSTFDAPNYWVTIAPITFRDASGALLWCTSHGLDSDHCYAKLVSTTHGAAGSTAFN